MPAERESVMGIGIAAPGPLNPETGIIIESENLPGWENVPLVDLLHQSFQRPVFLGNDANAAALGEALCGAARGCRHVVYLTVGTGIGGGFIVDGRLLNGQAGMASEVGFMLLHVDHAPRNLQDEASGPALERHARDRIAGGASTLILDLVDGDLAAIDSHVVGQAAQQGDPLALELVTRAGHLIGLSASNLVHLFNPQVIVIGGGVSQLGDLLLDPIRAAVREFCIPAYWERLRIEPAALGENAGVVGAGALVVTAGGTDIAAAHQQFAQAGEKSSCS
jgi:glucokinase